MNNRNQLINFKNKAIILSNISDNLGKIEEQSNCSPEICEDILKLNESQQTK